MLALFLGYIVLCHDDDCPKYTLKRSRPRLIGYSGMASAVNQPILYEPDERPPFLFALGLGFQTIMGAMVAVTAFVAITVRVGDQPDSYMSWAVFAAFAVSGIVIVFQSFRLWRFGAGYTLVAGSASASVVICATALAEGGPALMSTLIIVSTLFQFVLTARLSLLRRVITPTVAGVVLMLLAGTIIASVLDTLSDSVAGASPAAGPLTAALTLGIVLAIRMYAPPSLQQWTPVIAIGFGSALAAALGLFDFQGVMDAPLVGIPDYAWPGIELNLGAAFWALLPGFVVVNLVISVNAIGEGVAVQRVSWRLPRATDFRSIQGSLNTLAVGNLLAAFLGTLPNSLYPANAARTMLTGVASRYVGVIGGILLIGAALLPKVVAFLAAIPSAVLVGYLVVVLGLLFVEGMKMVVQDGIDARKGAVAGTAFLIGMGFHHGAVFPDVVTGIWGTLLGNGMTTGSIAAIALNLMLEASATRRRRLAVSLDDKAWPEIDEFLRRFASGAGWNEASTDRLLSVGEETLVTLTQSATGSESGGKRLTISARLSQDMAELEFIAASGEQNLEDRIAYMSELTETPDERDISLRILKSHASSVQHHKYYGTDIITVRVEKQR